jgi:hypothetical protein
MAVRMRRKELKKEIFEQKMGLSESREGKITGKERPKKGGGRFQKSYAHMKVL